MDTLLSPMRAVSFRGKVTAFLTLYLCGMLVVLSAAIVHQQQRQLLAQARQEVRQSLSEFAQTLSARWEMSAPLKQNRANVRKASVLWDSLTKDPYVAYAIFQDNAGQRAYTAQRHPEFDWMFAHKIVSTPLYKELLLSGFASRDFSSYPEGYVVEYLTPVRSLQGQVLGVARVGLRETALRRSLRGHARDAIILLLAIIFLGTAAGCLLIFWVAGRLESPIASLHQRARRLLGSTDKTRADVLAQLDEEFTGIEALVARLKENKLELASTFSHELRSPLVAIRGYTDLLLAGETGPLSAEVRRYLGIIQETTEHFQRFLDNVLDLVKLENRRIKIHVADFAIGDVLRQASDFFVATARNSGLALTIDSAAAAHLRVHGDTDKVFQVLVNLIGNALKFTPDGGHVAVGARDAGQFVEFFVSDDGPGIPPDQREKVFDEFYQMPTVEARRGNRGIGIGLTLCRRLVEAQGGRIWVDAETTRGTTMRFTLAKARVEVKSVVG